jgi:hypothetical protein
MAFLDGGGSSGLSLKHIFVIALAVAALLIGVQISGRILSAVGTPARG